MNKVILYPIKERAALGILKRGVKAIRKSAGDDEAAHSMEDRLRGMTLASIASGAYSKKECVEFAKAALKTKKIKFERWCA